MEKNEIDLVLEKLTKHKTIGIDFDGVLHQWNGKWEGHTVISGKPVDGALDWLIALVLSDEFDIVIFSSRCLDSAFEAVLKTWLSSNGVPPNVLDKLIVTKYKLPFWMIVDDRAHCFDGKHFPSTQELLDFEPWSAKPKL